MTPDPKKVEEIAAGLSAEQRDCVATLAFARCYDIDHEDERVTRFCSDAVATDTFNQCHELGLLRSLHNSDSGDSWVVGTPLGLAVAQHLKASANG